MACPPSCPFRALPSIASFFLLLIVGSINTPIAAWATATPLFSTSTSGAGRADEFEHLPPEQLIHAFYYLWYGTPEVDGAYTHWNHEVLPHWNEETRKRFLHGVRFEPPGEIHAPFFPCRGPYSSSSPALLRSHMAELRDQAGVGVVALSWWGPLWRKGSSDTQGVQTDAVLPMALDAADAEGVKVVFHLEPYPGRSADSVKEDLLDLLSRFGSHPALLRAKGDRPVFYVYDSYHIPPREWARLLLPDGSDSLRGGPADGVFLGLWLNRNDGKQHILPGGFDGFYTYFASEAVSYGANPTNWPQLKRWAEQHGKLFVASVGPGYNDSKIRPWNAGATRDRERGTRYARWWGAALDSRAAAVSITSFNEWGEGTQIEPSVDYLNPKGRRDEGMYMRITKEWAARFAERRAAYVDGQSVSSPSAGFDDNGNNYRSSRPEEL